METGNVMSGLSIFLRMIKFALIFGIIVFGLIKTVQFLKSGKFYKKRKTMLTSAAIILIVAVSWVLNMGWIRFMMTILFIPVIHSVIFFFVNLCSAQYFDKSGKLKILNFLFVFTFLLFYILMPDGGDVGEMYFFFGLIHSDMLSYIANCISVIAAVGHIVLFVMQIAEIKRIRKATPENK